MLFLRHAPAFFEKFSIWVALENKSKICRSVPSQRSINYFLPYWHVQGVNFTNMKSARNVLKIMEIIPVTYKLTSFKFMKFCNKIRHIINKQSKNIILFARKNQHKSHKPTKSPSLNWLKYYLRALSWLPTKIYEREFKIAIADEGKIIKCKKRM